MAAVSPFGHLPAAPICGYWRTSELFPELVRRVPILVYLRAANPDMKIAACRDSWSVVSRSTNDLEHGSIFGGKTANGRTIGTVENFPTKEAAWQAVRNKRTQPRKPSARSLGTLITQYRDERMPKRQSTRRGYNTWLETLNKEN
jgi:hypothetical protein